MFKLQPIVCKTVKLSYAGQGRVYNCMHTSTCKHGPSFQSPAFSQKHVRNVCHTVH